MKVTIKITNDQAVVEALKSRAEFVLNGIEQEMMRVLITLQSYIKDEKLHGGNPLNSRSGNLSRNILNPEIERQGQTVVGTIRVGAGAPYGKVHEYGGTFMIPEHIRRNSARGKSLRVKGKRGKLELTINTGYSVVKAHEATFPERSFMRSALADFRARIEAAVERGIKEAL